MQVYLDLIMGLNFVVDFLLLVATNRLSGFSAGVGRCALGALLGAAYAGACCLPGFRFLGNLLWRMVFLGLMGVVCFGMRMDALRRTVLFVLLSMALGGLAMVLGSRGFWGIAAAAAGLFGLCVLGFRNGAGREQYIPVKMNYGQKSISMLALRDTGNTLRDPVSGSSVVVAGADVAWELLGLSRQQLENPVQTMMSALIPGLRLIPYRSVGKDGSMLLALKLKDTVIGGRKGDSIVAFAPNILCSNGTYRALTGGAA